MTYAYRAGKEDFLRGQSVDMNPYPFGSANYSHWWDGWQDARSNQGSKR